MTAVRGFARYLTGIDPRTEVPPPGHDDIDEGGAVLLIRRSKFGKSRQVALQPSALEALKRYQHRRRKLYPHPKAVALFVS